MYGSDTKTAEGSFTSWNLNVQEKERNSIHPFKKNDVVIYKGTLARVGGFMGKRMSLHNYDLENKRSTQSTSPLGCNRLFNQKIMFEVKYGIKHVKPTSNARGQIPPTAEAGGLPLTP